MFLARDAEWMESCINLGGKPREFGAGLDAGPQDTRAALVRKISEPTKNDGDGRAFSNSGKRGADVSDFFRRNFSNKFQRDVNAFDVHPARASAGRAQFCDEAGERSAHVFRNIDRDEEAHDSIL